MPAKKKASASKKTVHKKRSPARKITEEHVVEPPSENSVQEAPAVTTSIGQPVGPTSQMTSDVQSGVQAGMNTTLQQTAQVDPTTSASSVPPVQPPPAQTQPQNNPQAENTTFQPVGVPATDGVQAQPPASPVSGDANKSDAIDQPSAFGPLPEPESKSKLWLFLVVLVIIAAVGGGGYFYYSQFMQKAPSGSEKAAVTPTEAPETSESTSSAEMEVKLDEYSIKVLNGSGVRGEAGRVQSSLEDAGFTVSEIGNADNSDYEKTLIQHKKDVKKGFLDKLKEELEKTYELDKNEELPDSASDEVIVIIGSTKAASDTSEE